MTLLTFAKNYSMPKEIGSSPKHQKMKVVIVRPYCSPAPNGPKYEQYCRQKLMLYVPFRHVNELKGSSDTFAEAYGLFLQSGNIASSLEDDVRRLMEQSGKQDQEQVCVIILIIILVVVAYMYQTG